MDASAAGWVVRHRKPRVDHDLASTQGRFLDHKFLYKDRFQSSLVLPFFLRGQVGGTITLASKEADRFAVSDARQLEPINLKLVDLLQAAPLAASSAPKAEGAPDADPGAAPLTSAEPVIRKQERQAAIGEFSAFLATEVREPLASIRAQLEEVTAEGILDFDPQTRVENAMRDLIRIEAILNEILDFAKPLDLNRRLCRVPEMVENALTVVATELEATRIQVDKEYAGLLAPVRADEAKMQQVFLSIFKNAIEAMTPGGILTIAMSNQRAARHLEVQILIKNNGAPIPPEHVDKVFEPFFTTKRSGTGLGPRHGKKNRGRAPRQHWYFGNDRRGNNGHYSPARRKPRPRASVSRAWAPSTPSPDLRILVAILPGRVDRLRLSASAFRNTSLFPCPIFASCRLAREPLTNHTHSHRQSSRCFLVPVVVEAVHLRAWAEYTFPQLKR